MILLDTHVLVWIFEGSDRLGAKALAAFDSAVSAGDQAGYAAITVWEIAMLHEKGRLALSRSLDDWIGVVLAFPRLRLVPLDAQIAIESARLPGGFHADPADRFIVATARRFDMTLLTADRAILDYASSGYLRAVDASV